MNHYQLTEFVRNQIREALQALGAAGAEMQEAVLIRDGCYCGRRFELDGFTAVWFIEEQQIKCFGDDGALKNVIAVQTPSLQDDLNQAA